MIAFNPEAYKPLREFDQVPNREGFVEFQPLTDAEFLEVMFGKRLALGDTYAGEEVRRREAGGACVVSGVNVLAVMDDAALEFDCQCGHPLCSKQRDKERISEARAAVAELVAEAQRVVDGTTGDLHYLRAALARVGGAA